MRSKLFLLVFLPLISLAQVNDMFYVPKKEVKLDDVTKILSAEEDDWGVADNGNTRDVDEYNRRVRVVPRTATEEAAPYGDAYGETVYVDDTDYDYYTRIVRFQNPTKIVICNPYYWDIYSPGYYYDGFWDTYWDYSWHYNGFNVNFHTGWYRPWYNYSWHTHYYHPHRYYDYGVRRTTARRIPVATSSGRGANGRVPVASGDGQKRRPVDGGNSQVRRERRTGAERVVNQNRERVGNRQVVENKKEERRVNNNNNERRSNSSTYNRRSSTSVNRSNSSRPASRTPVSRGGTRRSGRR